MDNKYGDVNSQDDSSCASDTSWDKKKDGGQTDQKIIVYDDDVDQDEINNLNEDLLQLCNGLGDNNNNANNKRAYIKQGGLVNEHKGQENHFGNANNNPQTQNEHFGGANEPDQNNINNDNDNDDDDNYNDNENKNHNRNKQNQVSEDDTNKNTSYDDYDIYNGDPKDYHQNNLDSSGDWNYDPKDEEREDGNVDESEDDK